MPKRGKYIEKLVDELIDEEYGGPCAILAYLEIHGKKFPMRIVTSYDYTRAVNTIRFIVQDILGNIWIDHSMWITNETLEDVNIFDKMSQMMKAELFTHVYNGMKIVER